MESYTSLICPMNFCRPLKQFQMQSFILLMRDKKHQFGDNNKSLNHSLHAVRQQLRNKLIQVGLQSNQCKEQHCKKKIDNKQSKKSIEGNNLPQIFSLKNSLVFNKEEHIKFSQNFREIFTQRDMFSDHQSFFASKINKSNQKPQQKSPKSFREQFQQKMIEEVKMYKMEQLFPNLKRSLRKQKLKTEADETISIRALKHVKYFDNDVVDISPRGRQRSDRSKTEEHKPKQIKIKLKKTQTTKYKQLTPWGDSEEAGNWLQQF